MTPNFSKLPRNMIIYFDSENLEKNHKNPCIDFWDCAYEVREHRCDKYYSLFSVFGMWPINCLIIANSPIKVSTSFQIKILNQIKKIALSIKCNKD